MDPIADSHVADLGDPDRHMAALLELATQYVSRNQFLQAFRQVDRARRLDPESPVVAALRERLLPLANQAPSPSIQREDREPGVLPDAASAVLLITLARGGGVARHISDRTRALTADGFRVVELRPDTSDYARGAWRSDGLGIQRIEIHHILGLGPSVLDLPGRLAAPYDVFIHDYSWICPRITLLSGDPTYCGEPALEACERCVATHGSLIEEDISVADLRARSARVLAGAARVVVPTRDVARRLARYFPDLNPVVSPWEPQPKPMAPRPRDPAAPIRVVVLGAIGEHKGYARLVECARDAARRNLPLVFTVVGYTENDYPLFETGRVFVTGPYEEGEVEALLEREACDVALSPSVWPETWCYTLTHLLRSGLPIVAFDLGAMAERLSGVERARLLPLDCDAGALNDALIAAADPRGSDADWTRGVDSDKYMR